MSFTDVFKKIFGTKADRDMKAIRPTLDKVLDAYKTIDRLSDDQLRERCQGLKDKIQAAISQDENRIAQIKEELETEISVGDLIDTIEYDYPTFHLSMDCFWAEIVSGDLVLTEHAAAKWLTKEELDSVEWLPADITLIEKMRCQM